MVFGTIRRLIRKSRSKSDTTKRCSSASSKPAQSSESPSCLTSIVPQSTSPTKRSRPRRLHDDLVRLWQMFHHLETAFKAFSERETKGRTRSVISKKSNLDKQRPASVPETLPTSYEKTVERGWTKEERQRKGTESDGHGGDERGEMSRGGNAIPISRFGREEKENDNYVEIDGSWERQETTSKERCRGERVSVSASAIRKMANHHRIRRLRAWSQHQQVQQRGPRGASSFVEDDRRMSLVSFSHEADVYALGIWTQVGSDRGSSTRLDATGSISDVDQEGKNATNNG